MQWQKIAKHWDEFLPKARRRWLALSDHEISSINGDFDRLVDLLQDKYELSADVAANDVQDWCETFGVDEDLGRFGGPTTPMVRSVSLARRGPAALVAGPKG